MMTVGWSFSDSRLPSGSRSAYAPPAAGIPCGLARPSSSGTGVRAAVGAAIVLSGGAFGSAVRRALGIVAGATIRATIRAAVMNTRFAFGAPVSRALRLAVRALSHGSDPFSRQ
jgi:hypothetical protein